MLRLGKQFVSTKTIGRTREKSAFVLKLLELGLKVGEFAYVSHKQWLADGGSKQSVASQRNGCRYSIRPHGLIAQAVTLSGAELEAVADSENRELLETDAIYEIRLMDADERAKFIK